MIIVNFGNEKEKYVSGLWQYDYGQVLRIQGLNLPTAVEIHFSLEEKGGTSQTRIGVTKDGVTDVVIPDSMLENNDTNRKYTIYAFVYLTDDKSGETIRKIYMTVESRPKPEAFDRPEDAELFRKAIKAVNESAERSAESEKQAEGWAHGREDLPDRAEDNAKYYSDQAKEDSLKTDADRKEVERLVESVSGIDEQVAKVEGLTKQAQTSATNAALSEQAAKESESGAVQAKEGAEAAQGDAEKSAQKTAEDRTAVESAKEEILQSKTEVEADRRVVEEIQKDVSQTGNTIQGAVQEGVQAIENAGIVKKQEIEQAGTTQKSAVENAGTKAIENINLAKQTAVEEVEATKTDAIDDVQAEGTTQTGNVVAEGEKQVQAVQGAAQEIVADREQIEKNTTDIADLRQNKANAIIETETGEVIKTEISSDSNLVDLKVFGKSEQVTTTGAQLFNKETRIIGKIIDNTNGNEANNSRYACSDFIEIPQGAKNLYQTNGSINQRAFYDESKSFIGKPNNNNNTIVPENAKYIRITSAIDKTDMSDIMLNTGETALPYEPYTGGKPSPSPEYPQEIISKEISNITVTGKNLINAIIERGSYSANSLDKVDSDDTRCRISEALSISQGFYGTLSISDRFQFYIRTFKAGALVRESGSFTNSYALDNSKGTFDSVTIVVKKQDNSNIADVELANIKIQLEYGESATAYEPYKEPQSLTLSTPNGLLGIKVVSGGNYTDTTGQQWVCDEIDLARKKYVQRVKKVSPSRTIVFSSRDDNGRCAIFNQSLFGVIFADGTVPALSTIAKWSAWRNGADGTFAVTEHGFYYKDSTKTLEEVNSLFALLGTNFEICGVLKTPIERDLSPEEISAFKTLHTNYPTTVITNDENAEMEVSYVADTKNYFLNREKAMQTQIANIQNALISQKISGGGIKVTDSARLPVKEFGMSGKTEQVRTSGKNLVHIPDIKSEDVTKEIPCLLERDVYISCHENSAKVTKGIWRIRIKYKDGSLGYVTDSLMETGVAFTCSTENPIIEIALRGTYIESGEYSKIQVEYGSAKTSYEPYTGGKPSPSLEYRQPIEVTPKGVITVDFTDGTNHQQVDLNCPREFTKWDRLEKIDSVWNWVYYSRWIESYAEESITGEYISTTGGLDIGATICYKSNPEYIPLPQAEQDKLDALTMYAPNTEITNNGGCNMELTYTVDTKSYVDTKIAEVSTAIVQKGIE